MSDEQLQGLTVLLVDDQSSTRVSVAAELDRAGNRVIEASDAQWALELFVRHRPDLVLLDVEMPGFDGYWTARQMRAAEPGNWTPIVFLSTRDHEDDVWAGIDAGGDDYLVRPVSPTILLAKMRAMQRLKRMRNELVRVSEELRDANAQLQQLSSLDALTGLMNRRALDERLHELIQAGRRARSPLTVVLCDVDHFKLYNDSLGHLEGDRCLQRVAAVLKRACLRPTDGAARYGGEEFALILPETPRSGAMTFARALTRSIAAAAIAHPTSSVGPWVTLSGGITTCIPDETTTPQDVLLRADDALYMAKKRGRNRFFSYEMQLDTIEQRYPTPIR